MNPSFLNLFMKKFTRERVAAELAAAGLALAAWHTDANEWFALSLACRAHA